MADALGWIRKQTKIGNQSRSQEHKYACWKLKVRDKRLKSPSDFMPWHINISSYIIRI